MSVTEGAGEPDVDSDERSRRRRRSPALEARHEFVSCPNARSHWRYEESVHAALLRYEACPAHDGGS